MVRWWSSCTASARRETISFRCGRAPRRSARHPLRVPRRAHRSRRRIRRGPRVVVDRHRRPRRIRKIGSDGIIRDTSEVPEGLHLPPARAWTEAPRRSRNERSNRVPASSPWAASSRAPCSHSTSHCTPISLAGLVLLLGYPHRRARMGVTLRATTGAQRLHKPRGERSALLPFRDRQRPRGAAPRTRCLFGRMDAVPRRCTEFRRA